MENGVVEPTEGRASDKPMNKCTSCALLRANAEAYRGCTADDQRWRGEFHRELSFGRVSCGGDGELSRSDGAFQLRIIEIVPNRH